MNRVVKVVVLGAGQDQGSVRILIGITKLEVSEDKLIAIGDKQWAIVPQETGLSYIVGWESVRFLGRIIPVSPDQFVEVENV